MISIFGIIHHSPGCAHSLLSRLRDLKPDVVLVEGPPDAQHLIPLVLHPDMHPPVALLVYAAQSPSDSVYYPFAVFSPEWQALKYAQEAGIQARFMDLPQAVQLEYLKPGSMPQEGDVEASVPDGS